MNKLKYIISFNEYSEEEDYNEYSEEKDYNEYINKEIKKY